MSELDQLFKKAIGAKKDQKYSLFVGIVKSLGNDTCKVDNYEDVRLNAVIDNLQSQFTIYPKIGSKVIVGRLEKDDDLFIVRVSEIEKVTIKIGDQLFEMKNGKFLIKKGAVSLKSILNNALNQLTTAVITTPSGPGSFSPADITAFGQINTEVNQLLL